MTILKKYPKKDEHLLCFDIEPDLNQWRTRVRKLVTKATKNVKVKGYRPGKVPFNTAIRYTDIRKILTEAAQGYMNQVVQDLIALPEVQNQNILEDSYKIDVSEISPDILHLTVGFFEVPELTKIEYKKIPLKPDNLEVSELEINNQLNMLVWKTTRSTEKASKEVGITNTDLVTLNYHGTYNNKPFAGSDGENYEIEMGTHQMIPGFEEKVLGLKVGDKKTFKLTLPKDFFDSALANKTATFKVEILNIKQMLKTNLTEDFIRQLHIPNVSTIDEIKAFYKKVIHLQKQTTQFNRFRNEIVAYLLDHTELNYYPELILKNQEQFFYNDYQKKAKQKHVTLEKYVTDIEQTIGSMQRLHEIVHTQAMNNIKLMFAIDKIIDDEHIKLEPADINKKYEQLALENRLTVEQVKKQKPETEEFRNELLQEKIFNVIIKFNLKKKKQ